MFTKNPVCFIDISKEKNYNKSNMGYYAMKEGVFAIIFEKCRKIAVQAYADKTEC